MVPEMDWLQDRDWSKNVRFLMKRVAVLRKWDGSKDDWFQDRDWSTNLLFLLKSSLETTQDRDDLFQDRDWSQNLLFHSKRGSFRKK